MAIVLTQAQLANRPGNGVVESVSGGSTGGGVNAAYYYNPDNSGGVDYFHNGTPVTNAEYAKATGQNTTQIENAAATTYAQNQARAAGGGGATTQTAAQQQAAAQAAQVAKYQQYLQDQAQAEQAGLMQSGQSAASQYRDQGTQYYDQALSGQNAINQARLGISTGQINSIRGLIDNIKNGLQSSRVSLGNANALDSSASDAIGRILQNYGIQQQNSINNDAATKQQAQDVQQGQLNNTNDANLAALNQFKTSKLGEIMQNAIQQLSGLKSSAALYGVDPNSFGADGIQSAVTDNANNLFNGVDTDIRGRLAAVRPTNMGDIAQQAYSLANAGVAGSGGTSVAPVQLGTPAQPGATNFQLPFAIDPTKIKQTA